jgi:toxin-antitoxin system PIN domain toxin
MIFLPDVNVWIALTSDRHIHHPSARTWLESGDDLQLVFCRVTEMGFLRLLTNPHVMGDDVLDAEAAWSVYDTWRTDERVVFLPESLLGSPLGGDVPAPGSHSIPMRGLMLIWLRLLGTCGRLL